MDCFENLRELTVKENAGGSCTEYLVAILLLVANHSINIFSILLFADDTALVARGENPIVSKDKVLDLLEPVKMWFHPKNLKINGEKTQSLTCKIRSTISAVSSVKLFGFHLDSKLSWGLNLANIYTRLS